MTASTICAIATAPGQGGVAIVRLSGPEAESILRRVFRPAKKGELTSHMLTYGHVVDGEAARGRTTPDESERFGKSPDEASDAAQAGLADVDECMAVIMRAPRSYTREDVAEIQLHGGSFIAQKVVSLCLREGAELAAPGEFTRRAFLNGRIDLSQAEAVMNLIAAQGEQSHRAAMRQLKGGASGFIRKAADALYEIQAGVAACIDYPEEIDESEAAADMIPRTIALAEQIDSACDERAARILQSGLHVALCGQPNVGKSSLLNALLGEERAIVTPIPGTTRDMVQGDLLLGGSVIHLVDTAGLHDTDDPVERLGVKRARRAMDDADLVLAVFDQSRPLDGDDRALLSALKGKNVLILLNKADLAPVLSTDEVTALLDAPAMVVSAAEEATLAPLKAYLAEQAAVADNLALTQPRHVEAARRAARHLRQAADTARALSVDMASIDLQSAQLALAEITGDEVEERLLDRVFGMFCVGK